MKRTAWSVVAFLALAGASAVADDAWISSSYANSYLSKGWKTEAIWQNAYVPTNADDVAHLAVQGRVGQPGNWWVTLPNSALEIDSVTDGMGYTMLTLGGASGVYTMRTMKGSHNVARGTGTLIPSSDTEPLLLERYIACNGVLSAKPAAGREVRVERLGAAGRVFLTGEGTLSLGAHVDPTLCLRVDAAGTVALGGRETNDWVRGAWFHVDVSKTNTITTVTKEGDARTYVSKIADADGGTNYLRPVPWTEQSIPADKWPKPWISAKTVNGVNLVDFGALTRSWNGTSGTVSETTPESEYGPGGILHFATEPQGRIVYEFFLAIELLASERESGCTPVISYSSDAIALYVKPLADDQGELFKNNSDLRWRSDTRIDGMPHNSLNNSQMSRTPRRLRVYSVTATNALTGARFFGGAPGSKVFGGIRLAEMLLYTNALTLAERKQNIDYLMRKWHAEESSDRFAWDAGTLDVRVDGAAVCVAPDEVARVSRLSMTNAAAGAVLAKKGAGRLVVNRSDATSSLRVDEGTVSFLRAQEPIDDSAPADVFFAHFDATEEAAFKYVKDANGDDTAQVLAWQDVTTGRWMTNAAAATVYPTRITGDRNMPCVDFGRFQGTGAASLILEKTAANGYRSSGGVLNGAPCAATEVFVVWHNPLDTDRCVYPIGACYNVMIVRASANRFMADNTSTGFKNAEAAQDGIVFDPLKDGTFRNGAGGWNVLRLSLPYTDYWSTMACKQEMSQIGGCRIGELIVYNRNLSQEERRNTEAYLLKKWCGKAHPDASPDRFGTLAFASGETNVLDAADGRVFARVTAPGVLVKKGAGAVTAGSLQAEALVVAEGSAAGTPGDLEADLFADARYHFDASAAGTMTTVADGDVTRLSEWKDCRPTSTWTAGIWNKSDWQLTCEKRPSLVAETIGGVARNVVDFGPYQSVTTNGVGAQSFTVTGESSCLQLHASGGTSSGWRAAKEQFVVCRDTDADLRGELVAGWKVYLRRGASGAIFAGTDSATKGLVEVDGERVAYSSAFPSGWHVLSIATPSAFYPEALGGDCGGTDSQGLYRFSLGGLRIAEVVSFEQTNTTARHRQITDYLKKKWLGTGDGYLTGAFGSLALAAGRTASLAAPALGRCGLETLDVAFGGPDACARVSVDGAFDLATLARIRVTFAAGLDCKACPGTYRILGATTFLNAASFFSCEKTVDLGGNRLFAELKLATDGIDLVVARPGLVLVFR